MTETGDTITAYLAAFIAIAVTHVDSFLTWGGVVLLCVRLIADIPRAFAQLQKVFSRWL